jgi:hypothetical protein
VAGGGEEEGRWWWLSEKVVRFADEVVSLVVVR